MKAQDVINVLKFPDRFSLLESIKAVEFAEQAILRDTKRKELIELYEKEGIYAEYMYAEYLNDKIVTLRECEKAD